MGSSILKSIPGRTLEETAALFDGEEQPADLVAMGGDAADIAVRLSRGVVLPEPEEPASPYQEKRMEYYELKKRYRESDTTATSSDLHHRAY